MSLIGILVYWCVHTATSCHLLKLVLLCPHCTMSLVEKGTRYHHIFMVTSCHLLRLELLHLYCTVWPVEIGTVTTIWQHLVTCWDRCFCVYIIQCGLLRLVLSCPYGNILSPVETSTIMPILQYLAIIYSDWYHHIHSTSWMHSKVQLYTYSCATKHY